MNAGNIDSNAYFGVTGSGDTTTDDGYGNDSNAVELSSSPTLLKAATGDLLGAGSDVGVDYDYNRRARFSVDVGPIGQAASSYVLKTATLASIETLTYPLTYGLV